jgi:hypothetical protein
MNKKILLVTIFFMVNAQLTLSISPFKLAALAFVLSSRTSAITTGSAQTQTTGERLTTAGIITTLKREQTRPPLITTTTTTTTPDNRMCYVSDIVKICPSVESCYLATRRDADKLGLVEICPTPKDCYHGPVVELVFLPEPSAPLVHSNPETTQSNNPC